MNLLATTLSLLQMLLLPAAPVRPPTWGLELGWTPSPDSSVAGYNLYYGTNSGAYTECLSVGQTNSVWVPNLQVGNTYFFAATSFDANGYESDYSNEASGLVPPAPPSTNVVMVGCRLETSPDLVTWSGTNLWLLSVTNPSGAAFFRCTAITTNQVIPPKSPAD